MEQNIHKNSFLFLLWSGKKKPVTKAAAPPNNLQYAPMRYIQIFAHVRWGVEGVLFLVVFLCKQIPGPSPPRASPQKCHHFHHECGQSQNQTMRPDKETLGPRGGIIEISTSVERVGCGSLLYLCVSKWLPLPYHISPLLDKSGHTRRVLQEA